MTKSKGRRLAGSLDADRRLLHELNNSLAAIRLRIDLICRDATCHWAQGPSLAVVVETLSQAIRIAAQLEDDAWKRPKKLPMPPATRTPKVRPVQRVPRSSAAPGPGRSGKTGRLSVRARTKAK